MKFKNILITACFAAGVLHGASAAGKASPIVSDGDFSQPAKSARQLGNWWMAAMPKGTEAVQDKTVFKSKPQSLSIESNGPSAAARQNLPALKPNTKYKVSVWIKTDKIVPKGKHAGATVNICSDRNHWIPAVCISGTKDWTRYEGVFTSGPNTNGKIKSYMLLYLLNCSGKAWFDDLTFEEVK